MDSETGSTAFLNCRDDRGRALLSTCYDLIGILRHAGLNEAARLKNSLIEKWVNCMIFEVTFPSVLESYLFPAFSVKEVLVSCHLTTLADVSCTILCSLLRCPTLCLTYALTKIPPTSFGSIRYQSVIGPRPFREVSVRGRIRL